MLTEEGGHCIYKGFCIGCLHRIKALPNRHACVAGYPTIPLRDAPLVEMEPEPAPQPVVESSPMRKRRIKRELRMQEANATTQMVLDAMQEEITAVIQKYVEIDRDNSMVRLERGDDRIALISSVPVRRVIERALPA